MINSLQDYLTSRTVKYEVEKELKEISHLKIGGVAPLIIYPKTENELVDLVGMLFSNNIRYKILGRTTNILFLDKRSEFVFVSTRQLDQVYSDLNTVVCEAGVSLPILINCLANRGIGGAEELSGIPGSIGGAVVSNAGAFGKEISNYISTVRVYYPNFDLVIDIPAKDCGFSYRSSSFSESECVVISARLKFANMDPELIKNRLLIYRKKRIESQPTGALSLGSVFKQVNGVSAGFYIDRCGLKGKKIGGAMIAYKHAGFILNNGYAKATDYLSLMTLAKSAVKKKFSVDLVPEIKII